MPVPTLDATVGGASANSYCTLVEAELYVSAKLYHDSWDNAENDDKTVALIWATRLLDEQVDWTGIKVSDTQALRWPRYDAWDRDGYEILSTIIPQWLKNATAEFAFHLLLKDRLQTMDDNVAGLTSVTAGSVSVSFDKMDRIDLFPPSVLSIIKDFATNATGGWQVPLIRR